MGATSCLVLLRTAVFLVFSCAVLISFPSLPPTRRRFFAILSCSNHLAPKRTVDGGPGTIGQFVLRRSTGLAFTFMAILRAEPRSVADSDFVCVTLRAGVELVCFSTL